MPRKGPPEVQTQGDGADSVLRFTCRESERECV